MSLAMIHCRATIGIDALPVDVEVHLGNGLPGFSIVGLPETSVREARDRVRSAILNSGFTFPAKKITVNLAPADLPKEGGRFDLPIAIGILAASEQLPTIDFEQYELIGELALSGELRPVRGIIAVALAAVAAKRQLILPKANEAESSLIQQGNIRVAETLMDVCMALHGEKDLASPTPLESQHHVEPLLQMTDIIGQSHAKRALEIAAAGSHNLLFLGPQGTGKTMLAKRLLSLLPSLTDDEALEVANLRSLSHTQADTQHWKQRPFRSPHHSASAVALVGGGSRPRPGEISLAHHGILFLDELPEFERKVLDALREPLETGEVVISRAASKVSYPARFQLIGAMNPAPTGHYEGSQMRSSPEQILRYLNRLSGPFLDRFDMSVEVPALPLGTISQGGERGESTEVIRARVFKARELQMARADKPNAYLANREIDLHCALDAKDAAFLEQALHKLGLSVRAYHRILKVARTIADLQSEHHIQRPHLAEALGYRSMDRLLQRLMR